MIHIVTSFLINDMLNLQVDDDIGGKMMYKNFRYKLFAVLLLLAIVISFAILMVDYFRMKESIQESIENQIEHATETTMNALHTIDKLFFLLDHDITPKMSQHTQLLQDKYENNPNVAHWDFERLSNELGMDIYLINEAYVIEHSNVSEEIGLDFSQCCKTLHKKLAERRSTGKFYVDHIDIDQKDGELKKFSYMATPDKKYIIELGYSLKNETIFQHFNFLNVANELVEESNFINKIHVFNFGGIIYGESRDNRITDQRKRSFDEARESLNVVEHRGLYKGEEVVFRYIPFLSMYDEGETKLKVVEIIYSEKEFSTYFSHNFRTFLIQFIIIIVATALVSSLLANWLAKPIHYAFHDSLTGLKNRAAFNELLKDVIESKENHIAFLMLDLDNFKLVNDYLGHQEGDKLLQNIAHKIKQITENIGDAFRLGGDEFVIILQNTNQEEVEQLAESILSQLYGVVTDEKLDPFAISVSIGISLSQGKTSKEELFLQADRALYASKQKGKNQYQIFDKNVDKIY